MPSRARRGVETGRGGADISSLGPESSAHAAPTQFRAERLEVGTETCGESWEPEPGRCVTPSHVGGGHRETPHWVSPAKQERDRREGRSSGVLS